MPDSCLPLSDRDTSFILLLKDDVKERIIYYHEQLYQLPIEELFRRMSNQCNFGKLF